MRKPGFGVVSLAVVLVTLLGIIAKVAAPYLPRPDPNALATEGADFLRQGGRERIDWQRPSQESFALARRLNRPIFLLVGTDYSQTGRFADNEVFSDPEVQALLESNVICMRVDGVDQPEWLHSFLPISRAKLNFTPGFQMWMLDPSGQQYDYLSPLQLNPFNARTFLEAMLESLRKLTDLRRPESAQSPPGAVQASDLAALQSLSPADPYPALDFLNLLGSQSDPVHGGFPVRDTQYLRSGIYRYLLTAGELEPLKMTLDPALQSGIVDWLDGGFFRASFTRDWSFVQVDKYSAPNAEMAWILTVLAQSTGDEFYALLARQTVDALLTDLSRNGYVLACRKGDDGLRGRSRRASFSVRFLRDLVNAKRLTSTELDFARNYLGLRVETNPQMLVRVADRKLFVESQAKAAEQTLAKLRDAKKDVPRALNQGRYLDVNGFVCARLLSIARLTGDIGLRQKAMALADALEPFRAGDDVLHSLDADRERRGTLGDYVAYAEALLEVFRTTGDATRLDGGLQVLKRAHFLFATDAPGLWNTTIPNAQKPWAANSVAPDVFDFEVESLGARTIRVCRAYGELFPAEQELRMEAQGALDRIGALVPELGPPAAGLMTVQTEAFRHGKTVFAVGPAALEQVAILSRKFPFRLVAPAAGSVRQDLQKKGAGIYIVSYDSVNGPLNVADTESALAGS